MICTSFNTDWRVRHKAGTFAELAGASAPHEPVTLLNAAGFNALPVIPNNQYTPPDYLKPFAALIQPGRFGQLPTWPNAKVQSDLNQGIQSVFIAHSTPGSVLEQMQQDLNP